MILFNQHLNTACSQYKENLESAYLTRKPPRAPPDGVHDSAIALYNDVMKRFKRLEVRRLYSFSVGSWVHGGAIMLHIDAMKPWTVI